MHFVADYPLLSLYHVPDIHFVFKDSTYGGNPPHTVIPAYSRCLQVQAFAVLVCGGCGYAHFGQLLCNAVLAHALVNEPVKNIPHYLGGFFINHKCVFVLRVFHVPVGGKCADKLAFPALGVERPAYVVGSPCGVAVIHQPGYGYFHSLYCVRVLECVK